jgi:hypothetical protein
MVAGTGQAAASPALRAAEADGGAGVPRSLGYGSASS